MPTIKFKSRADFKINDEGAALGYLAVVTFGTEEVYRGTKHHQDEEMAVDEAEGWITHAIIQILRTIDFS